jgi:hypothetical protein
MAILGGKMKLLHRLQERLADRVSFIQYPNIRPADENTRTASRTGIRFRHAMPLGKRIDLLLMSLGLLAVGLAGLTVVCFLVYAVLFQGS